MNNEYQYRKKPVVIEAFQFARRNIGPVARPEWFEDAVTRNDVILQNTGKWGDTTQPAYCEIKTLEGVMRGDENDWIIRGIKGEIYPCKPEIFEASYERATEAGTPAKGATASAAGTIDAPEFQRAMSNVIEALDEDTKGGVDHHYERARASLVRVIDQWGAARAEEARREAFARGHAEGLEDGLAAARLAAEGAQIRAAAQRTAGGDAVERLTRYAPDRSGMNMEACHDGVYVLLSDVQDMIHDAAQPVAEAAAQADDGALPCPFCGSVNEVYGTGQGLGTYCDNCGADGPSNVRGDKPVAAWNTRAAPTAQPTPPDDELPVPVEMLVECVDGFKFTDPESGAELFDHLGFANEIGRRVLRARAALRQPGALPDEAELTDLVAGLKKCAPVGDQMVTCEDGRYYWLPDVEQAITRAYKMGKDTALRQPNGARLAAIEEAAQLCDEMGTHWGAYKDTALLNGDVELSNAASGEPRAAEFLAKAIRALAEKQAGKEA